MKSVCKAIKMNNEKEKLNIFFKLLFSFFAGLFLFAVFPASAFSASHTGIFESAVIDLGVKSDLTIMSWNANVPAGAETTCVSGSGAGCAIRIQVAVSNCPNGAVDDPFPCSSGTWNFVGPDGTPMTYFTNSSGEDISFLKGKRYIKYKVYLQTQDPNVTPTVSSIDFGFKNYPLTTELVSSVYDSSIPFNAIESISWSQLNVSAQENVRIQIRTGVDQASVLSAAWVGPDDTSNSYWDSANTFSGGCSGSLVVTCTSLPSSLTSGSDDRFFQYKVIITSSGDITANPAYLTSISITYNDSGSPFFESATIDFGGGINFTTLSWTATNVDSTTQISCDTSLGPTSGEGCAVRLQVAANNDNATWNYVGPDGTSATYFTVPGQSIPSSLNGNRYFRYKLYLSSINPTTATPKVSDVTVSYSQYASSAYIISSPYNLSDPSGFVDRVSWTANVPPGTDVRVQVRTTVDSIWTPGTPDDALWSPWCGYSDTVCDNTGYFTSADNGAIIPANNPIRSGGDDQWVQYRVVLDSNGGATPTLSSISLNYNLNEFATSGTYTSAVFDTGQTSNFTTISYITTTSPNNSITIDVGAGNTPTPDASWIWLTNVPNGADLSALNGTRYVQYVANLSTTVSTDTPALNEVRINYYDASTNPRELISSPYDSGDAANVISSVNWTEVLPLGTDVGIQLRTAATQSGLSSATWLGPTGPGSYYTDPSGGETINPAHSDEVGDQWFQYKVSLWPSGNNYPTVSDVNVNYTYGGTAPTIRQAAYRFFENQDSTSVLTAKAPQNTPIVLNSPGETFRLRTLLHIGLFDMDNSNKKSYKLQFAEKSGSCDPGFTGENYIDITSSTEIAYNDNTPANGSPLTNDPSADANPNHLGHVNIDQTYNDSNADFITSINDIMAGQDGLWDFSLKRNGAPSNKNYCIRVVKANGSPLNGYDVIAEVATETVPDPTTETNNVRGWAWSGNIGWISFSCNNQDPNVTCSSGLTEYGVHMVTQKNIDDGLYSGLTYDVGALVGNAWSEDIGWITFDKNLATENGTFAFPSAYGDPFPSKDYMAKIDLSVSPPTITGWARALSAKGNSDWDGWIKLSGNLSPSPSGTKFTGYIWGEKILGWTSWSNDSVPYAVTLEDTVPTVSATSTTFADIYIDNRTPIFRFVYNDTNRYNLDSYSITIRKQDGTFVARQDSPSGLSRLPGDLIEVSYGASSDTCYNELGAVMTCPLLDRDTYYDWTVYVTNALLIDSMPSVGPQFYIQPRKYPEPKITWTPELIVPDKEVTLMSDTSVCYDYVAGVDVPRACSVDSGDQFLWTIPSSATIVSGTTSDQTLIVTFDKSGGCSEFNNSNIEDRTVGLQILGDTFAPGDWAPNPLSFAYPDAQKAICVYKPVPEFQEQRP